ncbi:MAG: tRNA (adenosine(37)-N6)-threonylcarbamoyltransferase complex ATPase subunit type 1 TsaE [Candidatus Wallacebacter cryptica]
MRYTAGSPQATQALGETTARLLQPGDVISLEGDLGAGKTQFVKGVGIGLGIDETLITSPTFTLINQYDGRLPVYHFDVYRIEPHELEDIGYDEYFYGSGVCLIEWGNTVQEYLPLEYLQIEIRKTAEDQREFIFTAHGQRYEQLISELKVVVQA